MAVAVDRDGTMEERRDFRSLCQDLEDLTKEHNLDGFQACAAEVPGPDLTTLLETADTWQSSRVVDALGCTRAQKTAAKSIINAIITKCLHPAMKPMEVYEAGSFKRGTALKYRFDVDLVMKLVNFDQTKMEQYMKQCKWALQDHFGDQVSFSFEPTHRCLKFEVAKDLQFDLLITGDPNQNPVWVHPSYYEPAGSHEVDDKLKQAKQQFPIFQALVMLCKHWKNRHTGKHFLKSFYVELLCYRLMQETQDQQPLSLIQAFKSILLDFIHNRLTVPNINPHSDGELRPWPGAIPEFQAYARETIRQHFSHDLRLDEFTPQTGQRAPVAFRSWRLESARECVYKLRATSVDNENRDNSAASNFEVKWEGTCRYVAMGTYTGQRTGQPCVVKWFKTGAVYEETFWSKDLKAVEKAA